MAQHAAHARSTHRRAIVAGAAVAVTVMIGAGAAAAKAGAPASTAFDELAPAFATALRAGVDGTRSSCIVERPHEPEAVQPTLEAQPAARASFAPSLADLAALPDQADPFAFCLDPDGSDAAPSLSEASAERLREAHGAFAERGWDVGYLVVDLETGCGLAGNLDSTAYGASTFKALYALYLCETQLDPGLAALDTPCYEGPATPFMDPGGTYLHDGLASYPLGTLAADSIALSDNDSYRILRASYDAGFPAWLEQHGLPSSLADDWYPTYSTRTAGMLWLLMAQYLDGGSASAAWLTELLGQTETSFLRDALGSQAAAVLGKAGWYADDDPAFCGVCDAGIASAGGRRFLVCAMSNAPFSQESEELLENLLATAFEARADLA